jgi:hypothetical protein
MASLREEWESYAPAREEVEDRLAEYERALAMPTDELIARYHGVDDRLLATMLDPARRAAASFTVSLAEESREALLDGDMLTLEWQDLTEQQQAELRSCLSSRGPWGGGGRGRRDRPGGPPGDPGWDEGDVTQVNVGGLRYGQMMLSAETERAGEESGRRRGGFLWGPWLNLTGEGGLTPDERVALRRGLGESISEDEERSMFREWMESLRDDWNQRWEERTRQAAEATIDEQPDLSPSVEGALSAFVLPVHEGASYTLWQVQEAVASASGMHIVSDCFSQPRRNLTRALGVLHPGQTVEMTGLMALRVSCLSTEDVSTLVWSARGDERAGWDWGDAGRFLRFRSKGRDLWRASMLPSEASERLDSWLDQYVPAPDAPERLETALEVTLDLRQISALAAGLSNLQLAHGGKLICGDPTDRTAAHRQALREDVLGAVWRAAGTLRALATFSDGQWEQVRGAGLRVAYDLTPDQRRALGLSVQREQEGPEAVRGPGRRRGGPGSGGRRGRGPAFGGTGLGGLGRWGVRVEDEGEMARLVLRLIDEPPWGGSRGRGPGGGERGRRGDREGRGERRGRGAEGRPGRGQGGGPGPWGRRAVASDYLTFSVDGDIRGAYPVPRVLSVDVSLPSPLGPAVPVETP